MIISRGNRFDEAAYHYGFIMGMKLGEIPNNSIPLIEGEVLYEFAEHLSEEVARMAPFAIRATFPKAENALGNLTDGLYDGIKFHHTVHYTELELVNN